MLQNKYFFPSHECIYVWLKIYLNNTYNLLNRTVRISNMNEMKHETVVLLTEIFFQIHIQRNMSLHTES